MTRRTSGKQRRNHARKVRQFSGRLESLESRQLLAGVTVGNALDVVDGDTGSISALQMNPGADGVSLREALIAANNTPGADTIDFGPMFDTAQTIALGSQLPTITDAVTIMGSTVGHVNMVTLDAGGGVTTMVGDGFRVMAINNGLQNQIDVALHNVNLVGGDPSSSDLGGFGGAIHNSERLSIVGSTISGNHAVSGGGIYSPAALTIDSSRISNNGASGTGYGGGIYAGSVSNISNSVIARNTGGYGGGIHTAGELILNSSTVSGNSAMAGGGIYSVVCATGYCTTVNNSTITENSATYGGGIHTPSAPLLIRSSILGGNTGTVSAPDLLGGGNIAASYSLVGDNDGAPALNESQSPDGSGNLIGSSSGNGVIDPQLGPLVDNGGPTETHTLLLGSPATDAGDDSAVPSTDQRGVPFDRNNGNGVDMGALEVQQLRLVVDTNADESDGDFSSGDLSLREAIERTNAKAGLDSISFDPAYFIDVPTNIILLSDTHGQLVVADDVTIDASSVPAMYISGDSGGNDPTVPGTFLTDMANNNHTSDNIRVFHITGGVTQLKGMTITGGAVSGSEDGGAFLVNYGATLEVEESTIAGNSAGDFGGAINNFGTVQLDGVTLSGNVAARGGGAINNSTNDTLVVRSSTIVGNTSGAHGGGIVNYGFATVATSEVSHNFATNTGGGIHNSTNDILDISNSSVTGNTAEASGGGVVNYGDAVLRGSMVADNHSGAFGGGIHNAAGRYLSISDSDVRGNSASPINNLQTGGRGASWYGGGISNYGMTTLGNVMIIDNHAVGAGGMFNVGQAELTGATFSNNSALGVGGAIVNTGALRLNNSTLSGNDATAEGGGLFNTGNAQSYNSTLSGNYAGAVGGGIHTHNDGVTMLQNTLVLGNASATAYSETGGPGVFSVGTDSIVGGGDVVSQLVFAATQPRNGVAAGVLADNGGAVETIALRDAADNPALDLSGLLPRRLTVDATGRPRAIDVAGVHSGGAIDAGAYELQNGTVATPDMSLIVTLADDGPDRPYDGETTLREALQYANSGTTPADTDGDPLTTDTITFDASLSGAAIVLERGELEITDTVTIDASPLTTPVTVDANQRSRVLNFSASTGDLDLEGLTLVGGRTTEANVYLGGGQGFETTHSGGGIRFASDGHLRLTNASVNSNETTGERAHGAGVFSNEGSVTLIDSLVSGNSASGDGSTGGAIHANSGTLQLTRTSVEGNSSHAHGGGISARSGEVATDDSQISNNSSGARGGGVYALYGDVTVINTTVSGNSAQRDGGGVSTQQGDVSLTGSTVSDNSAIEGGGGIFASGPLAVLGGTISGNSSGSDGGGIFSSSGSVVLGGSTITRNYSEGRGGGFFGNDDDGASTTMVVGSIIAGNTAAADATTRDLHPHEATAPTINYSLIGVADGLALGTSNLSGAAVAPLDPQLAGLADNGGPTMTHALRPSSPALDSGDANAIAGQNGVPEFDQRGTGFTRTFGRIDMGSVERQTPVCDFDGNGDCDIDDIDALVIEIAVGTHDPMLDLTGDDMVDLADRDHWLVGAGALNLTSANAYLLGDANLDGTVDGQDFIVWNNNKFQATGRWSQGDWNADGTTNGHDFIIWNDNRFQASDSEEDDEPMERPLNERPAAIDSLFAELG